MLQFGQHEFHAQWRAVPKKGQRAVHSLLATCERGISGWTARGSDAEATSRTWRAVLAAECAVLTWETVLCALGGAQVLTGKP